MTKGINYAYQELENIIVRQINAAGLPLFAVRDLLNRLLLQVDKQMTEQVETEKKPTLRASRRSRPRPPRRPPNPPRLLSRRPPPPPNRLRLPRPIHSPPHPQTRRQRTMPDAKVVTITANNTSSTTARTPVSSWMPASASWRGWMPTSRPQRKPRQPPKHRNRPPRPVRRAAAASASTAPGAGQHGHQQGVGSGVQRVGCPAKQKRCGLQRHGSRDQ